MGCSAAGKPPMHRLQRIIRIRSPALFIFKPFFIISSARGCTPPHDPVTTPVSTVETLDILFNKQIRTALFLHSSGHMQHTPSLTSSLALGSPAGRGRSRDRAVPPSRGARPSLGYSLSRCAARYILLLPYFCVYLLESARRSSRSSASPILSLLLSPSFSPPSRATRSSTSEQGSVVSPPTPY